MRKYLLLSLIMAMAILSACGQSDNKTEVSSPGGQNNETEKTTTYEPITLENAGRTMTFTEPPQRAVAIYQEYAELAVELGIEDRFVGYGFTRTNTTPEFEEKLKNIKPLAELYPSKEVFLGVEPDLFIAWESDLAGMGFGSIEELEELGIQTYIQADENPQTLENMPYKEIHEISRIFGVEEKGDELIQSIKNRINDVHEKIEDVERPLKVFYMRGGEEGSATTAGGDTLQSLVVSLAGGENIFNELTGSVVDVSWEEVVERNPDVIVFSYCCGRTPEGLMELISNNPALQDVTAVKNQHYVVIGLEEAYAPTWIPGGVEKLAKGFYPERFE